jgi:NADH-quinone oxidoreductase subunit N
MTATEVLLILPLIILSAGVIVAMLGIVIHRSHVATFVIAALTLLAALVALRGRVFTTGGAATPLIRFDDYAVFFVGLLLAVGLVIVALLYGYLGGRAAVKEECYILTLTALLGCVVLVASSHLASFFLGLELLSVSLYVLIGYLRSQPVQIEAALKYLVPASTSSAFLLFGMALIYATAGTMDLSGIVAASRTTAAEMAGAAGAGQAAGPLLLVGLVLVVVGIAFKLALVPFHYWAPDVYEGAPAPVTAMITSASKGALFVVLLRYYALVNADSQWPLVPIFTVLAVATMTFGNIAALLQQDLKRLLAYSSIGHMGFMLVAFVAGGPAGVAAVTFYLLAYFLTILGAFGVISVLAGKEDEFSTFDDYRGLAFRHPFHAAVLIPMMLSLAGVPLTVGFVAKFYVLLVGIRAGLWLLALVLVANSVIALFYYLRVVFVLYQREPPAPDETAIVREYGPAPSDSIFAQTALLVLTTAVIWLGVYPGPFLHLVQTLVDSFV